jgi:hypothetical protein
MSTSIDTAFVKDYQADVHHIFQREGGMLRPTVRLKTGIVGTTTTFNKIGKGVATTKARHGTITPMNQTHSAPEATLADFYAGDWVDKLDEAKTKIDERMALAKGGAWALGRKVDNQIITVLDSTSETTITLTVSSYAAILATLLQWCEALDDNDVPNDGGRFGLVTPRFWSQMNTVKEFTSSDWVGANGLPMTEGAPGHQKFKDWNGVKWTNHTDLPGKGTSAAKCFLYHKNSVGYATGAHAENVAENDAVMADITWHGDRASHFVNHAMSGGGALIDTTGVIEGNPNDTTAIATS